MSLDLLKRSFFILLLFLFPLRADEPVVKPFLEIHPENFSAGDEISIALRLDIQKGYHIGSLKPQEFLLPTEIKLKPDPSFQLLQTATSPPSQLSFPFASKPLEIYTEKFYWIAQLKVLSTPLKLHFEITYQACDDFTCLPPRTLQTTYAVSPKDKGSEKTPLWINSLSHSSPPNSSSSSLTLGFLLLLFLQGLALNLTPCVYPMIPLTIKFFWAQSFSRRKIFLVGFLYMLGIVLMFSILGTVAGLTGQIFGSFLQNRWVLFLFGIFCLLLAFDAWQWIHFPWEKILHFFQRFSPGSSTHPFSYLLRGLLVGVFAAPCIGPFVTGLLVWVAQTGSALKGFLAFFVMGLGMGLPYVFLAFFSQQISHLPRAGKWLNLVKQILGLILVLIAFYFWKPLFSSSLQPYYYPTILSFLLASLIFVVLEFYFENRRRYTLFFCYLILFPVFLYLSFLSSPKQVISWTLIQKQSTLDQLIEKEPLLLIDFSADWCLPCLEMEKEIFENPDFEPLLKHFKLLKVDLSLKPSPEIQAIIDRYQIKGVPTLIIYRDQKIIKRFDGKVEAKRFRKILEEIVSH